MYKVWLEWDLGQDTVVFTSREKAEAWINDAILADEYGLADEFPQGFQDVYDTGLCSIQPLEVI